MFLINKFFAVKYRRHLRRTLFLSLSRKRCICGRVRFSLALNSPLTPSAEQPLTPLTPSAEQNSQNLCFMLTELYGIIENWCHLCCHPATAILLAMNSVALGSWLGVPSMRVGTGSRSSIQFGTQLVPSRCPFE